MSGCRRGKAVDRRRGSGWCCHRILAGIDGVICTTVEVRRRNARQILQIAIVPARIGGALDKEVAAIVRQIIPYCCIAVRMAWLIAE